MRRIIGRRGQRLGVQVWGSCSIVLLLTLALHPGPRCREAPSRRVADCRERNPQKSDEDRKPLVAATAAVNSVRFACDCWPSACVVARRRPVRVGVLVAFAAGVALSGCTGSMPLSSSSSSSSSPASSSHTAAEGLLGLSGAAPSSGLGQRELTLPEKKIISDAVALSVRDAGSAQYRWPTIPASEEGQVNYCGHGQCQESIPGVQWLAGLHRRSPHHRGQSLLGRGRSYCRWQGRSRSSARCARNTSSIPAAG